MIDFYIFLYILHKANKNLNGMVALFFISVLLLFFSSFGIGFSFSFKETYKKYYKKLFVSYKRPYYWPFSRRKNHNRYVAFIWLTIIFSIDTIICGVAIKWWIPLIVSALLAIILWKIGLKIGEKVCNDRLKKTCEAFKINIANWGKEKKSPRISWRFFM